MPNREPNPGLFKRWLVLVYLPLGTFVICLALVVGKILTGGAVWVVGLLGLYCVVPARLLLETQRKGLELPKPPGAQRGQKAPTPGSNRGQKAPAPGDERGQRPPTREAERGQRPPTPVDNRGQKPAPRPKRAVPAEGAKDSSPVRERIERPRRPAAPRKSPQVIRRRALASIIGIGVLLLVGGILVIVGIGRVTSSFGLVMVGLGGFLMILSVTLPTFRLVDALLRGIGRLLSRRPAPGAKSGE